MKNIGIALTAVGVGSVLLSRSDHPYVFLEWAEPVQPYFGIGMAVLGIALVVTGAVRRPPSDPS
jgi:hypothetical protein